MDNCVSFYAHEIKNSLALIRANIAVLKMDDKSHGRIYDVIEREIESASLTLSEFSSRRIKDYFLRQVSAEGLVKEITPLFSSWLKTKGVKLEIKSEKECYALCDPAKTKQSLLNILKNAVEAVPEAKGKITVKIYGENGFTYIQIEDNGCGIPEEFILYPDSVQSTKAGGSGIGLAYVKTVMAEQSGELVLKRLLPNGTRAALKLPEK